MTPSSLGGTFIDRLLQDILHKRSCVVVGLDPRVEGIPAHIFAKKAEKVSDPYALVAETFLEFNQRIIDAVAQHAVAVKLQSAFYEQYRYHGTRVFEDTVQYAKEKGLLVIGDVKRNDIGATAAAYSAAYLGRVALPDGQAGPSFDLDAVTVNPYLGSDGIVPFVDDIILHGKGIFVLVKTSNPSSFELQDLYLRDNAGKLFEYVGHLVDRWGAGTEGDMGYKAVGAVVGATYSDEAKSLRTIMPRSFFLVPGYGTQGATAKDIMSCYNQDGYGAIVNASRSVIFAYQTQPWNDQYSPEHFDRAAEAAVIDMKEEINQELQNSGLLAQ